jgi:uncharacterized phage protein gp47/JayE
VLSEDTADGQILGIVALAINDANMAAIAVYNQFSPATAIGVGLSSVVKINGVKRLVATNSTVDLDIVGQAGTELNGAQASDTLGNLWNIPDGTTIDNTGKILATAVAAAAGAITAEPATVTTIETPVPGWQTVTNEFAAVPGAPVETDAELRLRQTISTALPSRTVIDGLNGGIAGLADVVRVKTYENDKNTIDPDGIPAHSIAVVVEGGDAVDICQMIALKKTPGCGTYGSVGEMILDEQGVSNFIKFFPLTVVEVYVEVTLTALSGYASTIGDNIISQVADFISGLPIGYDVYLSKVEAATEVPEPDGLTYDVTQVRMRRAGSFIWNLVNHGWNMGRWGGPLSATDVQIGFNEAAHCYAANVTLIVNSS